MSVFRQHGPCFASTVASLAAGAGFFVLYMQLRQEVRELRTLISQLQQDLAEAKREGRSKSRRYRTDQSGYYSAVSVTASSGDEDDDFEDALAGGDTDAEFEGIRRNVQFASPLIVESNTIDDQHFFKEIDRLLSGSKTEIGQAYHMLQETESRLSQKVEFQWRYSRATYHFANQEGERGDAGSKKELLYKAKDAAQAALQLDPSCADAHKWYAITLGSVGDYEATSEKIKNAIVIRDHVQMAIKLNPRDPTPHYMLGRWCYSVYMMTWLERKAASAFFGTPPTSTVDEALDHFMQAENLNPGKWKENMLYIAKCLIEKRQHDEAAVWLRNAAEDMERDNMDPKVKAEISSLLTKYGS